MRGCKRVRERGCVCVWINTFDRIDASEGGEKVCERVQKGERARVCVCVDKHL